MEKLGRGEEAPELTLVEGGSMGWEEAPELTLMEGGSMGWEEAPELTLMQGGSMGWGELEAPDLTLWFGGSRVPAGDLTHDDTQVIHVESFSHPLDTIRAGNAAGRPHSRWDSLLDGGGGKRGKSIDVGYGSGPTDSCGVYELQCSSKESWMPSSSGRSTEPAGGIVISGHCSGRQIVQHERSLQSDGVKHKIFISHSGRQKGFAEQLCEDLVNRGYLRPFFDQRQHSLPKGRDYVPLIKDAARHCHVAVMVLSKEFLCSKWPMIELAAFHGAQQAENPGLNLLPLFYELSMKDLDEEAIAECWMPRWRQLADGDARVDLAIWSGAVRALRKANGHVFGQKGVSEVGYRKDVVQSIFELSAPDLLYGSFRNMVGYSRLCEVGACAHFGWFIIAKH